MTLAEFYAARLDEIEDMARSGVAAQSYLSELGELLLREVEAKRRIVALHDRKHHQCVAEDGPTQWHAKDPCATLRLLVLPKADHPDYQQEWALTPA